MPLMLDDMRAEYSRHLSDHASTRFSMDKALAHVITIAYMRGVQDGIDRQKQKQTISAIEPRCPTHDRGDE